VSLEIRPLTADDDLAQELDLGYRAFGPMITADTGTRMARIEDATAAGRLLGAFAGRQLVASAQFHEMCQWWGGRPAPMAGVGGVKVAPEQRGRGTGRALVSELLALIGARGFALSALYPATLPLYRWHGWEITGGHYQLTLPARAARDLVPPEAGPAASPPALRRAVPADAEEFIAVAGRVHRASRDSGAATFDAATIARALGDERLFCYLADDGCLAYRWARSDSELYVSRLLAVSAATTRELWSVVGSHASVVTTIRASASPADPVSWLTREPDVTLQRDSLPWMLRTVRAPAAIAARGFPPAAELTAALELTDPVLTANSGSWLLRVAAGQGTLARAAEPGRAAPLRLGPRGFAALFGGTPLASLRRAGLAAGGDPDADALLDGAFAATPFMLDHF
jgi:predicted acetyltransferase